MASVRERQVILQEPRERLTVSTEDKDATETLSHPSYEPFPCLKTSGLSPNEINAHFERLLEESMAIRLAFTSLVSESEASLLRREIDGTNIHDELTVFHHKMLSGPAESTVAVFGFLREYWGFSDYVVLEHIILKLGTPEDRERLEKYQQSLAEFSQRRVFECPVGMFGMSVGESEESVTVKRADKKTILYDTSLNQVKIFSSIFKKEIDVDDGDMRLIGYQREGESLELKFGVLSSSAETIFPLSSEKSEKLVFLGVWLVSCGEYTFQQEQQIPEDYVDAGSLNEEEPSHDLEAVQVDETTADEPVVVFKGTMTCEDEDIGSHTAICINNKNVVVEVSNSSSSGFKAYKIGRLRNDLLQWKSGLKGVRYGMGKAPQIALNDEGYVVEVDEEEHSRISYRVGIIHSSNVMLWTESSRFTTGSRPSVALCFRTVIAAFKREGFAFYCIGTLDTEQRKITWSTQERRFLSVGVSDLNIASNHEGVVVALYTKQAVTSAISSLYASVGELNNKERRILFSAKSSSQSLSTGTCPSATVNRGNNVMALWVQQKGIQRKIKYRLGVCKRAAKSNAYDVMWSREEGALDVAGTGAAVALNDKGTVLVSHSGDGENLCHIGNVFYETTI